MSSRTTLRAIAVIAACAAAAFAGLYFLSQPATSRAVTKTVVRQPCGDRVFGHITAIARRADHFELRFDPAWFTSGLTANTAAAEDGAVAKGEPVPNDYYVVDEGHRSLVYWFPPRRTSRSSQEEKRRPAAAFPRPRSASRSLRRS